MRELVYTPLAQIEKDGEQYVLMERRITNWPGRLYTIHRVKEDGVPSDGISISSKVETRIQLPEFDELVMNATEDDLKKVKAYQRLALVMKRMYAVRPELKAVSYIYLGVCEFGNMSDMLDKAVLSRIYEQALRPFVKNKNKILTSLEEIYQMNSIDVIFGLMDAVGVSVAALKARLKNSKYEWVTQRVHSRDLSPELKELAQTKGLAQPRTRLTYDDEKGQVRAVYSDIVGVDGDSISLTRKFEKGQQWHDIGDIMKNPNDPFYSIFIGMLKALPDRQFYKKQ